MEKKPKPPHAAHSAASAARGPDVAEQSERDGGQEKAQERALSENLRMQMTVAQLEKILFRLPVKIVFTSLAVLLGRLIVASNRNNEQGQRNNRYRFIDQMDQVIRYEVELYERELRIQVLTDRRVEELQKAEPLRAVDRPAIEREIRRKMLAAASIETPANASRN